MKFLKCWIKSDVKFSVSQLNLKENKLKILFLESTVDVLCSRNYFGAAHVFIYLKLHLKSLWQFTTLFKYIFVLPSKTFFKYIVLIFYRTSTKKQNWNDIETLKSKSVFTITFVLFLPLLSTITWDCSIGLQTHPRIWYDNV